MNATSQIILRLAWQQICLFSAILLCGCSPRSELKTAAPASSLARVNTVGEIKALYVVYPPTVAAGSDVNKPSGFLIEILDEIAKRANLKVRYAPTTFDDFPAAIKSPDVDVVVGVIFNTPVRAREMDFTAPIMYWAGVKAIGSLNAVEKLKSLDDLASSKFRVAVTAGTAEHDFLKRNAVGADINPLPNNDISLTLSEVTVGHADVAFADAVTINKFLSDKTGAYPLFNGKQFNSFAACFVIKRGDGEWREFLNNSLISLQVDGTIAALSKKFGGETLWALPRQPWE